MPTTLENVQQNYQTDNNNYEGAGNYAKIPGTRPHDYQISPQVIPWTPPGDGYCRPLKGTVLRLSSKLGIMPFGFLLFMIFNGRQCLYIANSEAIGGIFVWGYELYG